MWSAWPRRPASSIFPTTITTVETEGFSGYTYPELLDVFLDTELLERTSMNSWDDQKVRDALAANQRRKVVVSGLWTEVCNNTFALCAMAEGGSRDLHGRRCVWRYLERRRTTTRCSG